MYVTYTSRAFKPDNLGAEQKSSVLFDDVCFCCCSSLMIYSTLIEFIPINGFLLGSHQSLLNSENFETSASETEEKERISSRRIILLLSSLSFSL
jgi:hypothetical protein